MRRLPLSFIAFLLAGLAGCSDPYLQAGTWHATGVNNDNLRAMVADPADLVRGVSQPGTDGQLAAAAVARLRTGQVKALQGDSIAKIGAASAAPASSASPPAGGS
jgi:type IV pilus biogenesis protein CpaD/CtpE